MSVGAHRARPRASRRRRACRRAAARAARRAAATGGGTGGGDGVGGGGGGTAVVGGVGRRLGRAVVVSAGRSASASRRLGRRRLGRRRLGRLRRRRLGVVALADARSGAARRSPSRRLWRSRSSTVARQVVDAVVDLAQLARDVLAAAVVDGLLDVLDLALEVARARGAGCRPSCRAAAGDEQRGADAERQREQVGEGPRHRSLTVPKALGERIGQPRRADRGGGARDVVLHAAPASRASGRGRA